MLYIRTISTPFTSPTAEILSGKNAWAWVSMVLYSKKYCSRNIKWQKCTGMSLNEFIFKKANENIKTRNPGSHLGVTC